MALSRIFQDEINAAQAIRRAQAGPSATTPSSQRPSPARSSASSSGGASRSTGSSSRGGASRTAAAAPSSSGGASRAATPIPSLRSNFDLEEIQAALTALSSVFNLQEGQLEVERDQIGRLFENLQRSIFDARDEAIEQDTNLAAGRGILRSGLYLKHIGRLGEATSEQIAEARGERDARLQGIARQLGGLEAQEQAERAVTARNLAQNQLATKEQLARALQLV